MGSDAFFIGIGKNFHEVVQGAECRFNQKKVYRCTLNKKQLLADNTFMRAFTQEKKLYILIVDLALVN